MKTIQQEGEATMKTIEEMLAEKGAAPSYVIPDIDVIAERVEEKNEIHSKIMYAWIYLTGWGMSQDIPLGIAWLEEAVKQIIIEEIKQEGESK